MDIDEQVALLERAYRLFGDRDVDALLDLLTDDVEWPDVAGGKVLRGKPAVRSYWETQFASVDPRVTPTAYIPTGEDLVAVVEQRVFDLDGKPLRPSTVVYHRHSFDGDRVCRMRVFADRNDAVMLR